jgi:hypothetical protein
VNSESSEQKSEIKIHKEFFGGVSWTTKWCNGIPGLVIFSQAASQIAISIFKVVAGAHPRKL